MNVSVFQRGGDKKDHPSFIRAVQFFAEELFEDDSLFSIAIKIYFVNISPQYNGFFAQRRVVTKNKIKTVYDVSVDRHLKFLDKIATIAHELVHVQQYESGRLTIRSWKRNGSASIVEWEGETYHHVENIEYIKHPWEIEANRIEKQLVRKWLSKYNSH